MAEQQDVGGGGGEVKAVSWPVWVPVSCGGRVRVRRITPSRSVDIQEAAGNIAIPEVRQQRCVVLGCRYAIEGADGLVDPRTRSAVPFAKTPNRLLGEIASEEVFDCLQVEDQAKVLEAAQAGGPSGAQQGN